MRQKIIHFLKCHPTYVNIAWSVARAALYVWGVFVPMRQNTMLFASFGGRKFDDSPRAIYEEVCRRPEFDGWTLIWAFVEPDKFDIPRGEKIKIDTAAFFKALLYSRVWVSNSGMDRGIELRRKGTIRVETWHGTPLKKIGGEENQNSIGGSRGKRKRPLDSKTLRCAQSEYDREIFQRIFNATEDSFILSDLPRNDRLLCYSDEDLSNIKEQLDIPDGKRAILYAPTYREYLENEQNENYIAPPVDLKKWEKALGEKYVLLFRAHYAVNKVLGIKNTAFVRDVSEYPRLDDLYAVSDIMISDYSSTFFDYSILDRPMFCFAYDREEYEEKRGLYLDLNDTMPCPVDKDEDSLLKHILTMDREVYIEKTKVFHERFAPNAGFASKTLVDRIVSLLKEKNR